MLKSYFAALSLFSTVFLFPLHGSAQKPHASNSTNTSHSNWSIAPFDRKVFIENKGQFDNDVQTDGRILYKTMLGKVKVYFTAKGITYRCDSNYTLKEKDGEETYDDPREEGTIHTISRYAVMHWQNANPNVSVIAGQEEPDYYTYYVDATKKTLIANAFKKLIYKNLYPGIDVEYTFPEKGGMEYTLLIHPGADAGKIKMKYTGEKLLALDEKGNLNIDIANPGIIDMLDHAPIVFCKSDNTPIASSFSLNGDVVSFNLGHYNASDEIVIDPWSINPGLTAQNVAFDVAKDLTGNVYVYGGGGAGSPWKVQKYTPGGVLIWTYTTTFASWYGDLAVDGVGNTYITEGCCGGGIREISPSGIVHWSVNNGTYEYWLLSFDCSYTHLYLGCAYSSGAIPAESVSNLDTANGVISGGVALPSGGSEPRDIAWAPNGNLYFLTVTAGNDVIGVTPAFAPLFSVGNGYAFLYNGPTYANGSNPTSAMNGIAAGKTFIATSDGATLMKRNINTGALISSLAIPGGVASSNSGIMIDGCGNIFVGSKTGVYEYDSLLNPITNVATAGAVYCLYPGSSGQVLACGVSFVASLNFPTSSNYSFITAVTPAGCACNGTAKVTLKLCGITDTTNVTYLWNNGQTTQTATNLCAGNYTVTISLECSPNTYVDSVTIVGGGGLSLTTTQTNVKCFGGATGSAIVTPIGGTAPYTYAWTPSGGTNATASNLTAGTYTITVKDKNGCTGTAAVTITQPNVLTAPLTVVNVKCFGAATGSIAVTAGGGTPAYTYAWAPSGGSGATASNLTIGTYTVTLTDANGCTITASTAITQPTALTASTVTTAAACGSNNGTAIVTPGGGTPAYTYSWAPSGGSGATASNLSAGNYTVTVTDANGCNVTASAVVTSSGGVTANITASVNISCNAGSNGSITVTPGGGTPAYTYLWNPSAETTQTATGLTAGSYTVIVTDANGCTATASITLTQPIAMTVPTTATPVLCNGGSTGSATVTPGGGNPAYTYSWAPGGQTNATASNLSAATYTVTVTDANGCNQTATATVTQPAALTAPTSSTPVLCNGGNTGSAAVIAGGGTGVYTYSWAPSGGSSATANNLTFGTYTITVTDANGCTLTATATVTQPTALTATITTTPAACGSNNGTATATPAGGIGAYTYSWNNGETTSTATTLSVGTYTVTVKDANGCSVTATATIVNAGGETATITASANIKCNGGNTGNATVTAAGGTAPYTYAWVPGGQTNATASNLTAGTYTVTVKDANGCIATASIVLTQPLALTATTTTIPVKCNGGNTGSATVTAGGGTGAYTYAWAPGGGTNSTINNLTAGTYTITVTDANGCTKTATAIVTQPAAITLTAAGFPTSCGGGSDGQATVIPAGGSAPYTYAWTPGGATNANATGLTAGTYTITVTDAKGCTQTATAIITQPAPIIVSFTADSLNSCAPLCVTFKDLSTDPGGTITKWIWDFGDGSKTSSAQNPKHCYSNPGLYSVTLTVTDNKGCTETLTNTNMIDVYSFPVAAFNLSPQPATIIDPVIHFTDKSTDAYGIATWLWNFNDPGNIYTSNAQNPNHIYSDTGVFCATLTVTNIHGCVDSVTECLIISPQYTLYIPDAFTPNGDQINNIFMPKGEYIQTYTMYIFDRWGMEIFHSTDMTKGWNGCVNGGTKVCQEDTYVYSINITDNLGKKHSYIGKVTLIK